jgi:hypothetical protein
MGSLRNIGVETESLAARKKLDLLDKRIKKLLELDKRHISSYHVRGYQGSNMNIAVGYQAHYNPVGDQSGLSFVCTHTELLQSISAALCGDFTKIDRIEKHIAAGPQGPQGNQG